MLDLSVLKEGYKYQTNYDGRSYWFIFERDVEPCIKDENGTYPSFQLCELLLNSNCWSLNEN